MKRRPIPPTNHLRKAIRKIDQVVWILYDEQLAANGAYIEAVSRGDRREVLKLYRAKFTALGDRAVMLEGRLAPRERRRAIQLTEYEGKMESLYEAARRLRSQMESTYLQQKRFKQGILEESESKKPKTAHKPQATPKGRRTRR